MRAKIISAALCLLVLLPQVAAADAKTHYSGPYTPNRPFEGFTGRFEAVPSGGQWGGFVATRSMLNEGGNVGWLELGWSDSWDQQGRPTGPTVYTCGGDRFGCPGNQTYMYGKLYPEYPLVPGNVYRFRVESCYFTDATWGSCAFFWSGQDGAADGTGGDDPIIRPDDSHPKLPREAGSWVLLDWKYSLCKTNRRCGAADTMTEVFTHDDRKPQFALRVPKVTISANGGQTLNGSANYRKSSWTHWGGCPGSDLEYPIVTTDATYVAYQVSSGVHPPGGLCGTGAITTSAQSSLLDTAALKAVLPGSKPPFEPQPNLPVPVIAEDSGVIVYPGE